MRRAAGAALLVALAAGPAAAHHSAAAYDKSHPIVVNGTVKEFRWANPHCWLYLEVPDGKGGSDVWGFEGGSVSVLARNGWKADVLKPGEHVKIVANPNRDGSHGGSFVSATTDGGQTYTIGVI